MTSPFPKEDSKDHLNDHRFEAYKRASGFVRHMKKTYENKPASKRFDKSEELLRNFQTNTPDNSAIKASSMPRSYFSNNIKIKINLVNAYRNLPDTKQKTLRTKSKEEKVDKKSTSRKYSPNKYNKSLSRLLTCTQRLPATPDVFLITQTSLTKTKEKTVNICSFKNLKINKKLFPFQELMKVHRKNSAKNAQVEFCSEKSVVLIDECLVSRAKPMSSREISKKAYNFRVSLRADSPI